VTFEQTLKSVERLVKRIVAGEAVFFVGAGFSLDSEPNTSGRLIRRLVARFAAITETLAARTNASSSAQKLRDGFWVTFGLGEKPLSSEEEEMVTDKTIDQLRQVYYNINDWMCSAFTALVQELEKAEPAELQNIRQREQELLAPHDSVPLDDFKPEDLVLLGINSGKALFLETMGFAKTEVFGGDPRAKHAQAAISSYGSGLRDRYFTIARLAREGLAPLILTTNFDLLLEGACRAAGFEVGDVLETDPEKPAAAYDRLIVIGRPTEFFERGTGYRAALLLKIHGCTWRFREERASTERLTQYLPSMVFTYREIQNWRKDSWSRDLITTLLRTRSIVLCGYSGADPVIHDTFRTVYEEILANRSVGGSAISAGKEPSEDQDTLAFFTGTAGSGEFAGLELLRAGSRAAGVQQPPLFDHSNYLPFWRLVKDAKPQPFPTMDELFVWIYHRTLRQLQLKAIRSDLARIGSTLLKRRVAPADVEAIREALNRRCIAENEIAAQWDESERSRREFLAITAWTNRFHVALLREFALMEAVARNQRSGRRVQEFRSPTLYFPLFDRPGWGAWGAVVELALRRMAGSEEGRKVGVGESEFPLALVKANRDAFTKTALVLRGPGAQKISRTSVHGLFRRVHEWDLGTWTGTEVPPAGTPPADQIWRWSFLPTADLRSQSPSVWFGEPDESRT
jgi:hypothetical protein